MSANSDSPRPRYHLLRLSAALLLVQCRYTRITTSAFILLLDLLDAHLYRLASSLRKQGELVGRCSPVLEGDGLGWLDQIECGPKRPYAWLRLLDYGRTQTGASLFVKVVNGEQITLGTFEDEFGEGNEQDDGDGEDEKGNYDLRNINVLTQLKLIPEELERQVEPELEPFDFDPTAIDPKSKLDT